MVLKPRSSLSGRRDKAPSSSQTSMLWWGNYVPIYNYGYTKEGVSTSSGDDILGLTSRRINSMKGLSRNYSYALILIFLIIFCWLTHSWYAKKTSSLITTLDFFHLISALHLFSSTIPEIQWLLTWYTTYFWFYAQSFGCDDWHNFSQLQTLTLFLVRLHRICPWSLCLIHSWPCHTTPQMSYMGGIYSRLTWLSFLLGQ